MMTRLLAITARAPLTEEAFVEIASIYNNVAYIFLYLESNEAHVNYDELRPLREAFYKDSELDAKLLKLILELQCTDPDVEESRQCYVRHLREKANADDPLANKIFDDLQAAAKAVLREIQSDQRQLLKRLGVHAGQRNPAVEFYTLASRTESAVTRAKLSQAWKQTRDLRLEPLLNVVDTMVETRRSRSKKRGYESVLAETLKRCSIPETTASEFLDGFLVQALESHERLEIEVRDAVGPMGDALDHFGYYVHDLTAGKPVPQFDLEGCLEYIFFVATTVFGLTLTRVANASSHVIAVDVGLDDRPCGQINFDLWETGSKRSANYTKGIRNRTDWEGIVQRPVAYVSCRFRRAEGGSNRITFQNVHSLFHEFGHAVNHLLIRKRLPTQSGLEYLPLERLEDLSMWFEKWVYHPQLADSLSLSSEERDGLALCRRVKTLEYRRTHVDRAVTAALDFDVHGKSSGTFRDSFEHLDKRFSVSRYCSLGDFPPYFTWPMFQANPGANFAYLWGAADSAAKFAPFMRRTIGGYSSPAEVHSRFSSCFKFDEPSVVPDNHAVFAFYDALPARDGSNRG